MEPDQKLAAPDGSPADAQGADYNNDEGHATDLASPDRDRNPLTRVSCWAHRPRSRRSCAEAPAYKLLEWRVLSSFLFLDMTTSPRAVRPLIQADGDRFLKFLEGSWKEFLCVLRS